MELAKYDVILRLITEAEEAGIKKAREQTSGLEKQFNVARNAFAGIFAAGVIKKAVTGVFNITKRYEQYNKILKVALGSQRASEKALDTIRRTAERTVFSVDELTSSYIKFANRGVKLTSEEIINLADLAASQGKSFDQLTEAVLDAQTGEFERLKEFGIQASKNGDIATLSFKGLNLEVANTPKEIQKALLSFGQLDGVVGSNAEQMESLAGRVSNIQDGLENIVKNIGSGFRDVFAGVLGAISSVVDAINDFIELPLEDKIQEERDQLNLLVTQITESNISQERRNQLIGELQQDYPSFLTNLNQETVTNEQLAERLQEANNQYILKIALAKQQERIDEAAEAAAEAQNDLAERQTDLIQRLIDINEKYNFGLDFTNKTLEERRELVRQSLIDANNNGVNIGLDLASIAGTGEIRIQGRAQATQRLLDALRAETEEIEQRLRENLGINPISFIDNDSPVSSNNVTTPLTGVKEKAEEEAKNIIEQIEQLIKEAEEKLTVARFTGDFLGVTTQAQEIADLRVQLAGLQEFLNPTRRTVDPIDQLPISSPETQDRLDITVEKVKELRDAIARTSDPETKARLEKELEELLGVFNAYFEDVTDLLEKNIPTISPIDKIVEELQRVDSAVQSAATSLTQLNSIRRQTNDEEIRRQEDRLSKAEELAERGNGRLLEIEQDRLDELLAKRERFEQRQRVIDNASIIAANAVAAAESIRAITSSFAQGGAVGIASGIATSLALAAQIGIITSTVNDAFSGIPGFLLGSELIGADPRFKGNKFSNGKDGYLFRGDGSERMVDGATNAKLKGFPNALLPAAVQAYKGYPQANLSNLVVSNQMSTKEVEKKLDRLIDTMDALDIGIKLDSEGFTGNIQQRVDKVTRRKRYRA